MATREDNLKKINAELEQLSDEELEKIAGGILIRPHKKSHPKKLGGPFVEAGSIPEGELMDEFAGTFIEK